ncbi:hypothetical protein JCGZ_26520 [Jatropha curcas]|uniref:Protein kinase domain-containing protein n=1 Tax=Jatropha curcas TaxID=180498 RepID=A0A067JL04_JATCU|nr:hypothetical protein JCGZ_26520 [Jatropha curcas]
MGPTSQSQTQVSTVVRGSVGYVDPEYYRRQHLTEKSDVYSFGVVLLEVLCARPPVIPGLPKEQANLADWARICYRRGALDRIMDPHLRGDADPACLEKFGEIAESCLRDNGAQRPAMSGVICELELALQLQETAEKSRNSSVESVGEEQESPLLLRGEAVVTTDDDDIFSVSGEQKEDSKSTVSSGEGSAAKLDPDGFKSNLPPYTPTEIILLSCGASSLTTSPDGRNWVSDARSKFGASISLNSSFAFKASGQDTSVTQVPYMTARIFLSKFTYSFPVSPGSKFVRLYFYPVAYSNLDISKSFFSVEANDYTLLSNFSAFLTVSAMQPPAAAIVKEFVVTIQEKQMLNITFNPSLKSFAFINGIEIVSMPDSLYIHGNDSLLTNVGIDYPFYLDDTTALETVYRLNVGGRDIDGSGDTGMYRKWVEDSNYIFGAAFGVTSISKVKINYTKSTPAWVAPELVYSSMRSMGPNANVNINYNLTWLFPVDTGFNYLVRLHFCETRLEVTGEFQLIFSIFINNQTVVAQADVILWSGGNGFPVYKDYVVWVPAGVPRKQDLWLALHPSNETEFADAILNGLEIFKLNNSEGSLAGPNPEPIRVPPEPDQHPSLKQKRRSRLASQVLIINVAVFGGIFSLILCLLAYQRRRKAKDSATIDHISCRAPFSYKSNKSTTIASPLPTERCRRFTILEIKEATRNFDDQNFIGSGGFGEMILIYDYLINGTLGEHLHETNNDPLPWKKRLHICIGAARGLHYLHSEFTHTIIHRDVKTTNILLDENWIAKVSDFGLSKAAFKQEVSTTIVKGTWGYLDPEYARYQILTEKSDVYSFGLVLLEVLCALKPLDRNLVEEHMSLAIWAEKCIQNGNIYQIIDPYLKGKIAPRCFKKFVEIAFSCIHSKGIERPNIRDVMEELEFALKLQEDAEAENMGISPDGEIVHPDVSFFPAQCVDIADGPQLGSTSSTDFDTSSSTRGVFGSRIG